jgi:four helix bundle protein
MPSRNYQDLTAWQEAMALVEVVYKVTRDFPKEEQFCLVAQIRRAAISIPSNIAEGQGRRAPKEFARFLQIAHGSLREVETQLLIAKRLEYLTKVSAAEIMERAGCVGRLITGLINSLRSRE